MLDIGRHAVVHVCCLAFFLTSCFGAADFKSSLGMGYVCCWKGCFFSRAAFWFLWVSSKSVWLKVWWSGKNHLWRIFQFLNQKSCVYTLVVSHFLVIHFNPYFGKDSHFGLLFFKGVESTNGKLVVWVPVVWICGISLLKGIVTYWILLVLLEFQTTRPQTTNLHIMEI